MKLIAIVFIDKDRFIKATINNYLIRWLLASLHALDEKFLINF